MITRRHIRRGLVWSGLVLGALGLLGYALALFVSIYHDGGDRIVFFGRGAITVQWAIPRPQTLLPGPGGASVPLLAPPPPVGWATERRGTRPWRWLPMRTEPVSAGAGPSALPGLFVVPYWIPVLIGLVALYAALPPGAPKPPDSRCPSCRFDLSTAPAVELRRVHVRCPECGTLSERDDPAQEKPAARAGGS